MKKINLILLLILVAIYVSCAEKKSNGEVTTIAVDTTKVATVEHGEYMVNVLGCTDCHTPKKMTQEGPIHDMEKYMMGFDVTTELPPVPDNVPIGPWVLFKGDLTAAVGPWGTSYAGNLTPHETGIGTWSLEQFEKALREAKFKGMDNSRPIMPPMP
jgi:hypothetical protein